MEKMNNENVVNKESGNIYKRIGKFLLFVISYLLIPQLIAIVFYKVFKLGNMTSMFIGNMSYVLMLILTYYKMFKEKIKDYFDNFGRYFGTSLKYWGFGLIVMFISNLILAYVVFPGDIAANEELNREAILGNQIIGLISLTIIAPFVEEMIFRFGLREVTGKSTYFPLVSALVFGIPHVLAGITAPFGFNDLLQFLYVIPYGALGYAFGYIYNKTDNIFASMSMHFLHNLMCFLIIISAV